MKFELAPFKQGVSVLGVPDCTHTVYFLFEVSTLCVDSF